MLYPDWPIVALCAISGISEQGAALQHTLWMLFGSQGRIISNLLKTFSRNRKELNVNHQTKCRFCCLGCGDILPLKQHAVICFLSRFIQQ